VTKQRFRYTPGMAESDIETRVEELEDALKAYKTIIDSLKDDLSLIISQTRPVRDAIVHMSGQTPNDRWSPELIER